MSSENRALISIEQNENVQDPYPASPVFAPSRRRLLTMAEILGPEPLISDSDSEQVPPVVFAQIETVPVRATPVEASPVEATPVEAIPNPNMADPTAENDAIDDNDIGINADASADENSNDPG